MFLRERFIEGLFHIFFSLLHFSPLASRLKWNLIPRLCASLTVVQRTTLTLCFSDIEIHVRQITGFRDCAFEEHADARRDANSQQTFTTACDCMGHVGTGSSGLFLRSMVHVFGSSVQASDLTNPVLRNPFRPPWRHCHGCDDGLGTDTYFHVAPEGYCHARDSGRFATP